MAEDQYCGTITRNGVRFNVYWEGKAGGDLWTARLNAEGLEYQGKYNYGSTTANSPQAALEAAHVMLEHAGY
jgi:hypothetical protein